MERNWRDPWSHHLSSRWFSSRKRDRKRTLAAEWSSIGFPAKGPKGRTLSLVIKCLACALSDLPGLCESTDFGNRAELPALRGAPFCEGWWESTTQPSVRADLFLSDGEVFCETHKAIYATILIMSCIFGRR